MNIVIKSKYIMYSIVVFEARYYYNISFDLIKKEKKIIYTFKTCSIFRTALPTGATER